MLTLDRDTGAYTDRHFRDFPALLNPGDLLILNNSRVIPARLFARRGGLHTQSNSPAPSGPVEVLLAQPLGNNRWRALVKPARKVPVGERLIFESNFVPQDRVPQVRKANLGIHAEARTASDAAREELPLGPKRSRQGLSCRPERSEVEKPAFLSLTATVTEAGDHGERTLQFDPVDDFFAALDHLGHIPLPPYIHRDADQPEDRARYQTVYAGADTHGSAAAPTAGLHFTPELLDQIRAKGVEIQYVTLHVGLGTFLPVRAEDLASIRLHAEAYTLPAATADAVLRAKANGRRIVAVGTTTTRTLEHIAATQQIAPHTGSTSIFLQPGHRFQLVDALLTNFHLPQSTLLMLVSAFASRDANPKEGRSRALAAYAHAVDHHYRFFSYGDCMFLS